MQKSPRVQGSPRASKGNDSHSAERAEKRSQGRCTTPNREKKSAADSDDIGELWKDAQIRGARPLTTIAILAVSVLIFLTLVEVVTIFVLPECNPKALAISKAMVAPVSVIGTFLIALSVLVSERKR